MEDQKSSRSGLSERKEKEQDRRKSADTEAGYRLLTQFSSAK